MTKIYRTARGKNVDMEALSAKHGNVAAVGNMNVNARGDEIGSDGKVIRTREQVMKDHHDSVVEKRSRTDSSEPVGRTGEPASADAPSDV